MHTERTQLTIDQAGGVQGAGGYDGAGPQGGAHHREGGEIMKCFAHFVEFGRAAWA